ncbi:MAG: type II CAAX endopeptidase family protein [Eubacteriales bacterium]|nr:type II CAAX endopeptidase family protein [Eubacteriales bacterium]
MQEKVFTIRQSLSIYALIIILFYVSSIFFQTRYGVLGIPLTQVFGLLLPGFAMVLVLQKDFRSVFLLNATKSYRYYWMGIGLWLIALIASGIYASYAIEFLPEEKELLDAFNYIFENVSLTNQILMIAVLPAIVEELLFRGLFLSSFLKHTRPSIAIIATSLMFAAMHFSLLKLVTTFILGCTFGYVVYKSKSIYPAIFLHFLNNGFSVLVANLLSDFEFIEPLTLRQNSTTALSSVLVLFIAVIIMTYKRGLNHDH